jgi:hypothetical protein
MDELVASAKDRKLDSHFKTRFSTTIGESVNYHLNRFVKAGYVRVEEV